MPKNVRVTIKQKAAKTARKARRRQNKRSASTTTTVMVPHVRGKGGYFTDLVGKIATPFVDSTESKGVVNKAARTIGEAIGGAIPIPGVGKLLGNAGSWLARLMGSGKYTVRKNSLVSPVEKAPAVNAPPVFGSIRKGADIVFAHREFVANVKSSGAFRKTSYVLNPGNPLLFPWMSKIASLYEEYSFEGLVLEYKPTSAAAVGTTSSAMGIVIMATDYDAYDDNYSNKRSMEAAEFSCSSVPYQTFIHPIECDSRRNVLKNNYVVPGITSIDQAQGDARFSIPGIFTIAVEGQQAEDTDIGELWVSYHVRFSRPILEDLNSGTGAGGAYTFGTNANGLDTTVTYYNAGYHNLTNKSPFTTSFQGSSSTLDFRLILSPKLPTMFPQTYLVMAMSNGNQPINWQTNYAQIQPISATEELGPIEAYPNEPTQYRQMFVSSSSVNYAGIQQSFFMTNVITLTAEASRIMIPIPLDAAGASHQIYFFNIDSGWSRLPTTISDKFESLRLRLLGTESAAAASTSQQSSVITSSSSTSSSTQISPDWESIAKMALTKLENNTLK